MLAIVGNHEDAVADPVQTLLLELLELFVKGGNMEDDLDANGSAVIRFVAAEGAIS